MFDKFIADNFIVTIEESSECSFVRLKVDQVNETKRPVYLIFKKSLLSFVCRCTIAFTTDIPCVLLIVIIVVNLLV